MKKPETKKLVLTALFTALVMVSTLVIRIPLPLGYVNLGDAFILLSVFILGPLYGGIAAGLGAGLADLVGYITYAPATLVIKAAMAVVAWFVYSTMKKGVFAQIVAGICGAVVMAFGYFVYESLLFNAGVAIVNVPWNLLQGGVGVILSVAAMKVLKTTKILEKIQN
jgi:uncharacterized membrane protein